MYGRPKGSPNAFEFRPVERPIGDPVPCYRCGGEVIALEDEDGHMLGWLHEDGELTCAPVRKREAVPA